MHKLAREFLGRWMNFHKSELAFFLLIALIVASGLVLVHAYDVLAASADFVGAHGANDKNYVVRLLFGCAALLGAAVFFGGFFIYPQIRTQVREQGKLREMTESLSVKSESLQHAALTDGLTGMQNRRYFDDALREYMDEFRKIEKPVGLMIIDLDHFKAVNDTHGHDIGDQVLRNVAKCLRDMTRYHDVVARLGGEEFAVVAPNMDMHTLTTFAERIRKAIGNMVIVSGNVRLKVTASLGLAVWDRKESQDQFVRRADMQLYQAKRAGRDRVSA